MKKGTNHTNVAIVAAAALFVGLAGNVQAIPITLQNQRVNQALRSSSQASYDLGLTAARAVKPSLNASRQVSRNLKPASPTSSLLSLLIPARNAAGARNISTGNSHRSAHGVTTTPIPVTDQGAYPVGVLPTPVTILPVSPVRHPIIPNGGGTATPNAVSVPDGGATAAMLGGSVCGIALLRKKLKA
ncbi:MAG: VPDSG-CTERM sorting domain-containing protein [Verrucomicrobiota bacterium]|jgi:VPDSG-CTERM motif